MSTEIVKRYIQLLLKEWDMGDVTEQELFEVWIRGREPTPPLLEEKTPQHTFSTLKGLKKAQLQDICKADGLNTRGTKQMLMDRILGVTTPPTTTKKKSKQPTMNQVLRNLQQSVDKVCIRRNIYNRYEHADTKFVFDEVTKSVIGKQEDDGKVSPLTAQDIELCQEYNFTYELPENLA